MLQKNNALIALNLGIYLVFLLDNIFTLNRGQQNWKRRNKKNQTCIAEQQYTNYAKPRYIFCLSQLLFFIEGNMIGNEGAKEIGFALQKNNVLTTLDLGMLFV
eukprot:TRINITY_DN1853_c0_g2_i1.p2 TRINITY_DN1853_c0_g2~~TRINITY_DN1853_c0_g2_i1.p2  ORF type:complete len:103 (+),score=1.41 TRINITY_DN1853_c0_g2_i1:265-573(+)